jgi:hypothetical protein
MPTNILQSHSRFGPGAPEVLASEIGLRAPRMLTLDQSYFSGSPVVLAPGTIICKLPSGKGRAYPSGTATGAVATSAKVLPVSDPTLIC